MLCEYPMNDIGFPSNLPAEFRLRFMQYHNAVVRLNAENYRLKEQLNSLKRLEFGSRSEKFKMEDLIEPQNSLFNEPEAIVETAPAQILNEEQNKTDPSNDKKNPRQKNLDSNKKGGRKPLPENLPREIKNHDLPEEKKVCAHDNTNLVYIGFDKTEKLDVVPASLKVIEHRYFKYTCPCCEQNIVRAATEPSLIPASIAEPGLLAHIATNKYFFALPLYRQEALFKQMEIDLPRITLARWMMSIGEKIAPLVARMKEYLLSEPVLHCDETTVQVLKGTNKKPTSKSYMWVMASGSFSQKAVVFEYFLGRNACYATEFLSTFKGYLHVDGYAGYNEFCSKKSIIRVGCWAHVRRKFESAFRDGAPKGKSISEKFLQEIQNLFFVERELENKNREERLHIRKEKAPPIIARIRSLIDENVTQVFPRSKLGEAFGYISNEWEYLQHFLTDDSISLSNNRVENAIRPFAVGRKNWLFSDTVEGAKASAAIYSLVVSAKENDLNIEDYLEDVFKKLPTRAENDSLEDLLPWVWKRSL